MSTPFDDVIESIKLRGYHNHRLEDHSDIISEGIYNDLLKRCDALRTDAENRTVEHWINVPGPGARLRKIDLLVGEPDAVPKSEQQGKIVGKPDLSKIRIGIENKSVITAHRNKDARFDDLTAALRVLHGAKAEAVLVATVLVGLARKVLNIPDGVRKTYKDKPREFEETILPRLSSGDESLWREFSWAVSDNRGDDPQKTVEKFRTLPLRKAGLTHISGYDYLLLVPVYIDNVNPPALPRPNELGIDVDAEYEAMLNQICKAYTARWHL
jgi:hypothetical protein